MFSSIRTAVAALALVGSAIALSGAAEAQTFTFAGSTQGAFNGTNYQNTATDAGLKFTGSTFGPTPVAAFGSTDVALGSFTLNSSPATNYNGQEFNLAVSFSLPSNTLPSPGVFNAVLVGRVTSSNNSVNVSFDPTPLPFTFPIGNTTGAFTLQINPINPPILSTVTVPANGTPTAVTGHILITAVPGPVAGAGLPVLIGLAGAWFMRRRRREPQG